MERRRSRMLAGVGLGAGMMYLLDPVSGRRRRALLRDQLVHAAHRLFDAEEASVEDVRHRARGVFAELKALPNRDDVVDLILIERVRSRMGRLIRHPGAIYVTAENGTVTLRGPILADEVGPLIGGVRAVPGVRDVINQVDVHAHPDDTPGLQRWGHRGRRSGFLQENWPPAQRLFVGTCGALLAIEGFDRRGIVGSTGGTLGLLLLARSLTNVPLAHLFGLSRSRRGIDVHKTINVDAPVERLYELWSQGETFPRFMEHVLSVHRCSADRWSWTVAGPAGLPVHWEAEVTMRDPNRAIAWRSVSGSIIPNAGIVRFDANPDGSTRIDLRMTYAPPGGLIGHGIARLLGCDPRHDLDDDLVRFKSLIDYGRTRAHGHEIEAADLVTSDE
jgi:uncharacterized membrane protein